MSELFDTSSPKFKSLVLPVGLAVLGIVLLGYGLLHTAASSSGAQPVTFTKNTSQLAKPEVVIKADIEGAVVNPGVYGLSTN